MITETVVLTLVTVVGGGIIAIGKSYIEGKANAEVEEIKGRADELEERLAEAEKERDEIKEELEAEIKSLKQDVLDLETRLENWKHRYWGLQIDMQELKMVVLRIMERADIPTDQFEALIQRVKEDGRRDGNERA